MRNPVDRQNPSDLHWIEALAAEGSGYFEDYFPESASGEMIASSPYYGRNVIWDGIPGRMVRVHPGYMQAISGNIFDPDKLMAIVSGIEQADDRVVFIAPYGETSLVELQDVKESIEAAQHEDEELDRPLTTGDEELDKWLVDPDEYLEDQGYDPSELEDYLANPDSFLDFWRDDPEKLQDKIEEMKAAMQLVREMQKNLKWAVEHDEGDLGAMTFQIRDGNHRAFGALLAGEPYIYMIVSDNQMQNMKDPALRRTRWAKTLLGMLE